MKYTILFTCYDPRGTLREMTAHALQAIEQNSPKELYELISLPEPGGFGKAVNRGFREAKGDYIVIISNDVLIEDPDWLEKLAIPGTITSFHLGRFFMTGDEEPDCSMVCIPREVREKVGEWDEQFSEGYGFDDNDYCLRARRLGVPFKAVDIKLTHLTGKTYDEYFGAARREMTNRNHVMFVEKWKGEYPELERFLR